MLDGQPRYDSYKDSGVDWIGPVPSDWSILRNGALFREVKDSGNDDLPVLSVSIHSGVSTEELTEEENIRSAIKIADRTSYKEVKPGYVAYNMMRAWQGGIGFVSTHGMVSPAYVVAKPIAEINAAFFEYLYRTDLFIGQMDRFSKGITDFRKRLYWEEFKTLLTVVPPLPTQDRIVRFLDEKTAEIDAAIQKKRRLIDLLNEQKAILINRAVTKGLNPDAPMKDSGVDRIGEIPKHWKIASLKHYCSLIKDGLHHTPEKHDQGANFVSTQHVRHRRINIENATRISIKDYHLGHTKARPEAGDVLITLVGSIGFSAIVRQDHLPLSCTRHVGYVRCRDVRLNQDYLVEYFESAAFKCFVDEFVSQTAQPSIYLATLADHGIPLPPPEEQIGISNYCYDISSRFKVVLEREEQGISTLNEFKQTLIANAVTGKIKI